MGEREILITRRMIEAGTDALNDSGIVEVPTQSNAAVVEDIMRAAFSAGGFSLKIIGASLPDVGMTLR